MEFEVLASEPGILDFEAPNTDHRIHIFGVESLPEDVQTFLKKLKNNLFELKNISYVSLW